MLPSLRSTHRLAVLTGAGISAESGVPTFREAQTGLWAQYDPQELATPEAFARNPQLVWEWYAWRRALVAKAAPNPGHLALVELEKRTPVFTLITQNVDNLHQKAGSRNVLELHGNLQRVKCLRDGELVENWTDLPGAPPACPRCGAPLRPDVVWFGEALPSAAWQAAQQAARTCQVFFTIGTSALVQPAASLPFLALEAGALVVEVNPEETPFSPYASLCLRGKAGTVLPELVREMGG